MVDKTLAEIAREAWWGGTGPTSANDWQAVADAVVAAHEAREAFPIPDTLPEVPEDREASQPTAVEVIAACRVALEYLEVAPFEHCIEHDQEGCRGCASKSATSALALVDRWKEANHGK